MYTERSFGLSVDMRAKLSPLEEARYWQAMKQFASGQKISFYESQDQNETIWIHCDTERQFLILNTWNLAYLMALGFDEAGNRK